MDSAPEIADRVRVPWGVDHVEGVVTEMIGMPREPWAQVEILLEGMEEPMYINFPISMIEPAQAA
ncbi:hypothetical protein EV190_1146 [Actinorugispora endophytica]|uniref:Uncharacterized protein n=1 Tax=Actinorugispora endophytica TaxID=1605990 RepID=A0A4R6USB1_9ACTN|nr:hypothetical protein EV190_1146 [Actinorugispora endophytica]